MAYRDKQSSTPENANLQGRLREPKVSETLRPVPLSVAPPRCPIRRESMDIDELEGIDLSFFLSLQSPDRSCTSDGSISATPTPIKTLRKKGRRARGILHQLPPESSANIRLLVAKFDKGFHLGHSPIPSRVVYKSTVMAGMLE
jgi:hypothetical protein